MYSMNQKFYLGTPFILLVTLVLTGCTTQQSTVNENTNSTSKTNTQNQNLNIAVTENSNVSKNSSNENVNVVVETTEDADTKNWKIYMNEEYGFSVQYPADWKITQKNEYDCIEFISQELISYNEKFTSSSESETDAIKSYDINICQKDNSKNLILNDWVQENVDFSEVTSQKNILLNGENGVELTTTILGTWVTTYIAEDSKILRISRLKEPIAVDSNSVEKIISTIELLQ